MAVLEKIKKPCDIRLLPSAELSALCQELRQRIIQVTSRNSGHLAANLGVVELTVALHRVFDFTPGHDVIVFDVGHQSYAHRILSGLDDRFDTLRMKDGLSGFTRPDENPLDYTVSGHASVSLSSAIGFARAKKLRGEAGTVVCVVGDGAFTGGLVYEAMNNIDMGLDNLVVILNDNSMSISKNKSSLSRYLMQLRTSRRYTLAKRNTRTLLGAIPLVGKPLVRIISSAKSHLRRSLYSSGTMFEEFGFNYIGVVDGHDLPTLIEIMENCKTIDRPVFLHIVTKKGKGYPPAEENPGMYHSVSGFQIDRVNQEIACERSYSNAFGCELTRLGGKDDSIVAISAAMKYATGLYQFALSFPNRFFDVGICEEHAVVFAGGLALAGFKPVVAIYSTFLQRAYDQIFHDVFLSNANVLFAIDRAGLVGSDGETHQGIFDAAYLSEFGLPIASPASYSELACWLPKMLNVAGPSAIRYPRGGEPAGSFEATGLDFDMFSGAEGADCAVVTYGRMAYNVLEAAALVRERTGSAPDVVKLNLISPVLPEAIEKLLPYRHIVFVEEAVRSGGVSEHYAAALAAAGYAGRITIHAIDRLRIPHMTVEEQFEMLGFMPESIADLIVESAYENKA